MAQSRHSISPDNLNEWLSSVGFLFPSNETELERFDTLHKDETDIVSDEDVSVERILSGTVKTIPYSFTMPTESTEQISQYRMAARKGGELPLPPHILNKIRNNQENSRNDDSSSPEKADQ